MRGSRLGWAAGLWAALLAGILVAGSPRYWAVAAAVACASSVIVGRMFTARDIRLPRQAAVVIPIGIYGFLQMALHTTALPHLTLETSLVWLVGAATFLVSADIMSDRAARRLFLDFLMWSLTVLAIAAMLQAYLTPEKIFGIFSATPGGAGTLLSKNQFAAMMELAAPIALWHAMERNPVAGGLCFMMILAAAITVNSRAGVILIGAELVVFLITILLSRRRDARTVLAIAAGLLLVAGVASLIAGTDLIRAHFADRDLYAVRRPLLDSTLKLIRTRPFSGYGLGTWRSVYPQTATFDMAAIANEAHNDWAQWTSDGGIPFGLLVAALVVWIAAPALRSIWGMGVISVMAHSFVDYPIREPVLSFLWFAMAGAVSQFLSGQPAERQDH